MPPAGAADGALPLDSPLVLTCVRSSSRRAAAAALLTPLAGAGAVRTWCRRDADPPGVSGTADTVPPVVVPTGQAWDGTSALIMASIRRAEATMIPLVPKLEMYAARARMGPTGLCPGRASSYRRDGRTDNRRSRRLRASRADGRGRGRHGTIRCHGRGVQRGRRRRRRERARGGAPRAGPRPGGRRGGGPAGPPALWVWGPAGRGWWGSRRAPGSARRRWSAGEPESGGGVPAGGLR